MSPTANSAVRDRLRIAIQKSGRLSDPARALLASSGLSWRESRDKLFCYGESLPVDLLLVRDDDIPGLNFSGNGRGSNTLSGKFVVWEFVVKDGKVTSLAIDFVQYSEGNKAKPLVGMLRYNSSFK